MSAPSQFLDAERRNGVRMPWNTIPLSLQQRAEYLGANNTPPKAITPVPITTTYTPLAQLDDMAILPYKPIECGLCKGVLNPYSRVDLNTKGWTCCLCLNDNKFPPEYAQISANCLPSELHTDNSTVEYVLPPPQAQRVTSLDHLSQNGVQTAGSMAQIDSITREKYPTFIFTIDTAIEQDELNALKRNLVQSISTMPPETTVGLITFGKNVEVHELGSNFSTSRSFCIRGDITEKKTLNERILYALSRVPIETLVVPIGDCELHLLEILNGLETDPWENDEVLFRPERATGVALYTTLHLITHYTQYIFQLNKRAIGVFPRVVLFVGGISTRGIGASASVQRTDHIRSHASLLKNKKEQDLYHSSCQFYHDLAFQSIHGLESKPPQYNPKQSNVQNTLSAMAHTDNYGTSTYHNPNIPKVSYDIFAGCLDQVGLAELSPLVEQTNGMLVLDDSFTRGVIRGSLKSYLATVPDMLDGVYNSDLPQAQSNGQNATSKPAKDIYQFGFNAIFEVAASRHIDVCFSTGNLSPLPAPTQGARTKDTFKAALGKFKSVQVFNSLQTLSDQVPFTSNYYINTLTPTTTLTTVYSAGSSQTANKKQQQFDQTVGDFIYFQFKTRYRDSLGRAIIRVTTIARPFIRYSTDLPSQQVQGTKSILTRNFDQHAAIAVMTRLGLTLVKTRYPLDVTRWYDAVLVELGRSYGSSNSQQQLNTNTNKPTNALDSFAFPPEMAMLPELFFNLRRSQLYDIFNSSPDETAFFRLATLPQTTANTTLIIQPDLITYNINAPPLAVPLDPAAIDSKRILLLDTFFHIVIWYGNHIAQWKEQELHLKPEYGYLNDLMKAPLVETKRRLAERFPTPRYIECVEKGSQSRFLMAKLNPVEVQLTEHQLQQQQMYRGQQQYDQHGNLQQNNQQQQQSNVDIFSEAQSLQDYILQFKELVVFGEIKKKK